MNEYGVGYIKMDYNIEGGIGTECGAESFGDGLLRHGRAYLAWLDEIFAKYPELTIESCSSGAQRANYALLSRHSLQSATDQTNYLKNAVISAASSAGICPEQCAGWAYPMRDADLENVAMNMVSTMLIRIFQSGHLAEITPEGFDMVAEGISVYKKIRKDIKPDFRSIRRECPTFPTAGFPSGWTAATSAILPSGESTGKPTPSLFRWRTSRSERRSASIPRGLRRRFFTQGMC